MWEAPRTALTELFVAQNANSLFLTMRRLHRRQIGCGQTGTLWTAPERRARDVLVGLPKSGIEIIVAQKFVRFTMPRVLAGAGAMLTIDPELRPYSALKVDCRS